MTQLSCLFITYPCVLSASDSKVRSMKAAIVQYNVPALKCTCSLSIVHAYYRGRGQCNGRMCVQSLMLIEPSASKIYRDEPGVWNTRRESYLLLCLGYLFYEVSQKVPNLVNHPQRRN